MCVRERERENECETKKRNGRNREQRRCPEIKRMRKEYEENK